MRETRRMESEIAGRDEGEREEKKSKAKGEQQRERGGAGPDRKGIL